MLQRTSKKALKHPLGLGLQAQAAQLLDVRHALTAYISYLASDSFCNLAPQALSAADHPWPMKP